MKNKKLIPSLEQRNRDWLHKLDYADDEIDLIVNVRLMPEWESFGFSTQDVEAFRYKMNQGLHKNLEKDITDDDLLLDGLSEEFPGEECIIKGLRRPNDNTLRHMRDRRAKNRHMREMKTVGGYDSICRGENGKTHFDNSEEWEAAIVATKEKHEPYDPGYWRRVDRRKSRHNGRAECREIPDVFMDDAEEERHEFYKEKADGTVDVDFCLRHNWLYADLDDGIYGEEYDEEEDDLKREIATYKDFLEEFNLNKLYQTWLDQTGKG